MATKLYEPPLITAAEFLAMDFGDHKAELDNGVIRMMAGGTARHARVQQNILVALAQKLRGTGSAPYGSDMATQTNERAIRYPDVTVFCGRSGPENDAIKAFDDPKVIVEILSAGTARTDLRIKLPEYKALSSVDAVVFVDIESERVRVVWRTGPDDWAEHGSSEPDNLDLPSLGITLAHSEIFARD